MTRTTQSDRITTGIESLDGGLFPSRAYMVTGDPGTGKTVLGLHFLTAGRDRDETTLFVNMEERTADVRRNAAAVGFDLEGVEFLDLTPSGETFAAGRSYDVFSSAEAEGPDVNAAVTEAVESLDPDRVFVDPLSHFRNLAPDAHQFRQQVGGFVQLLGDRDATVLFTSAATERQPDEDLQYLSDGTVVLERRANGRKLSVPKFRGSDASYGPHSFRITDDGIAVFPKPVPGTHAAAFDPETIPSGVPELDQQMHGGIERGTVTVLSGPSGVGKTTLGTQFVKEAAGRGERSVVYTFEESTRTFLRRSSQINIPVAAMRDRGTLAVEEIESLQISPDEFAAMVRTEVEREDATVVMIDGIDGYRLSLRGAEDGLTRELHSLCRYLTNVGVTVILVDTLETVTGDFRATAQGVSYLADNVVFLRYLETRSELGKALGILKMRTNDFERTLREFEITEHGISVGDPLSNLRGILSGAPEFVGDVHDAGSAD